MNKTAKQRILARSNAALAAFQTGRQQYNDQNVDWLTVEEADELFGIQPGDEGDIIENARFTGTYGNKAFFIVPTSNGERKISTRRSVAKDLEETMNLNVHICIIPPNGEYENPLLTIQYAEEA